MRHACVVVLGDIGRSPRMRYHALSLAKEGFTVDLVGYHGTKPQNELLENQAVKIRYLCDTPVFRVLPQIFVYFFKAIWQIAVLLYMLLKIKKPDVIILQNPPAIPSLLVCWIAKLIRGSKLVIDWHNYGYTIMMLKLKETHPLVRFAKWFEMCFGRKGDHNLCVTKAMKAHLNKEFNVDMVSVLYDRPAEIYRPICNIEEIHSLFLKLKESYDVFKGLNDNDTLITTQINGEINFKNGRSALIISSTSWTEDEDFSILLSALERYNSAKIENNTLPDILCVITGKGPLKEYYENLFNEKDLAHVKFCMPWLSAEDYASLLGCCDLGISLHYSSSGLDLPMKVVDMFGCGLPVCAIDFKCIDELVKNDYNGKIFHSDEQLADFLLELFEDFPAKNKLNWFKNNLKSFDENRWHDSWRNVVLPIINDIVPIE